MSRSLRVVLETAQLDVHQGLEVVVVAVEYLVEHLQLYLGEKVDQNVLLKALSLFILNPL